MPRKKKELQIGDDGELFGGEFPIDPVQLAKTQLGDVDGAFYAIARDTADELHKTIPRPLLP